MLPDPVVKYLNVLKDAQLYFLSSRIDITIHLFNLHRMEKRFSVGIVIAIPFPTHAGSESFPG